MSRSEIDTLLKFGRETGHPELAARMVRAMERGLADLDALPRDDAFWRGWANDRVTVHKLHDYAAERLEREPGDRTARWALVALDLAYGANDGGLSLLGPEIAADPAVVADALVIADWIEQEIGLDLQPYLRAVLAQADRDALNALARTADGRAARTALRVLDGGDAVR